jgi:protein gp37
MATKSAIEWTDFTWNPLTGCNKISAGCKNCYADRMAKRLKAMGVAKYANGFELTLHENVIEEPLKWREPRTVFVNSMSDMFHEDVPFDFINRVFNVMYQASIHTFQVLTKRSKRLLELNPRIYWPNNVWMGVSVENSKNQFRIDHLRETGAHIKFLSLEPLLGPLKNLDLQGIDWVIVGGESGPRARQVKEEWIIDIRDQCMETGVPFFFKQWGGVQKKRNGRHLHGRTWDDLPKNREELITAA